MIEDDNGLTYVIGENPPSITCLFCERKSYNPTDIAQRYCGTCRQFHDVMGQGKIVHLDIRPKKPDNYTWYSVCSRHREYEISCNACNAGRWISGEEHELEHWLYEQDYKLWYKWANRPESASKKALEEIFPHLKDPVRWVSTRVWWKPRTYGNGYWERWDEQSASWKSDKGCGNDNASRD